MAMTYKPQVWVTAVIAVAAGLLAAWSAREHLRERTALLDAAAQTSTVTRLVAAHDLPAGTRLHADLIAIRDVPVDYAASDTLEPSQFADLDGRVLRQALRRGDMIVAAHVQRRVETFSARLEAGRRAVTIPVDELNALSGMLMPGDRIDLYVSFEHRGRLLTAPLLQGVRVLATGRQAMDDSEWMAARATRPALDARHDERASYSAITLDVAAADAIKLVLARQSGRMTAMLRHPEDGLPTPVTTHDDLAALLGVKRVVPPRPASPALPPVPTAPITVAAPPPIPVIYGDQPVQDVPDLGTRQPTLPVNKQPKQPEVARLESDMTADEARAWLASTYDQPGDLANDAGQD